VSNKPTVRLRWFDTENKQFVYEGHYASGEWYFPITEHRSSAVLGKIEDATYTPDASPSDPWTPDTEP
jgi:hypothetical protein